MKCQRKGCRYHEDSDPPYEWYSEKQIMECPECGEQGKSGKTEQGWNLFSHVRREVAARVGAGEDYADIGAYISEVSDLSARHVSGLKNEARAAVTKREAGEDVGWGLDEDGSAADFYRAEGDLLIKIDVTNDNGLRLKYSEIIHDLAHADMGFREARFTEDHRIVLVEDPDFPSCYVSEELTLDGLKQRLHYIRWWLDLKYKYWNSLRTAVGERYNPLKPPFNSNILVAEALQPSDEFLRECKENGSISEEQYQNALRRGEDIRNFRLYMDAYEEGLAADERESSEAGGVRSRTVRSRRSWRKGDWERRVLLMFPGLDEDAVERVARRLNEDPEVQLCYAENEGLLIQYLGDTEVKLFDRLVLGFSDGEKIEANWTPVEV